ncbi:hypothetical protein A2U01_0107032, partial [Trifolium medium]|nr:hypothetical protein [Trifolium medium]
MRNLLETLAIAVAIAANSCLLQGYSS